MIKILKSRFILAAVLFAAVSFAAAAAEHPNLVEAKKLLNKAVERIDTAQSANEFDLGGFAEKAKNDIREAKEQINLAAMAANGGEPGPVRATLSKEPALNIYYKKHPNLAEAELFIREAYDRLTAAQKANEYDMEGHAQKAKDLLDRATKNLKLAADFANKKK